MIFNWNKKEDLLERIYFTGSMPLLTANHSFRTCGSPEAFTSATMFMICGVRTSSGRQEHYILRTHLELSCRIDLQLKIPIEDRKNCG